MITIVGGTLGLAVLALVTTSGATPMLSSPPEPGGGGGGGLGIPGGLDGPTDAAPTSAGQQNVAKDVSSAIDWTLVVLMVLALVVVIGWLVVDRRSGAAAERRRKKKDNDVLPEVADQMARDADAQRAALTGGTPRNAIVACWLQLEDSVSKAGLPRDPAETSAEFTERVLTSYAVDDIAITALASLYREARFSEHTMGEDSRQAAVDWLAQLHLDVRVDQVSA